MAKPKKSPPVYFLRKHFDYDPETGIFSKIKHYSNFDHNPLGPVGSNKAGYLDVRVKGKNYKVHRLIWKFVYGVDPEQIDHINRNKSDNRLVNLRNCSEAQNHHNKIRSTNNLIGIRKCGKRWSAKVTHAGQLFHYSSHECPLMAHLAYVDAKREVAGEFSPV